MIVQSGPTGPADIGCTAPFESLVRRFEDGRLNVIVQGLEPVELVEESEGHLYFSARVRPLADEPGEPDAELADAVLARFRALADLPDDAMPPAPRASRSRTPSRAPSSCQPGPRRSCSRAATRAPGSRW